MASINLNYFTKSYMLEFLEGGQTKDVFTFSVPPEGEQFDFSQRVAETKTFGGSVFENYGNDTIRISLSGSTGNGEAKIIYRGMSKLPKYLTGENEIWYLQKVIQEWCGEEVGNSERKVYLYDLSKMNALQILNGSPSHNWWRVIIKDFQIKRQVSKPIYYQYQLEMVALAEDTQIEGTSEMLSSIIDAINEVNEAIEKANLIVQGTTDALAVFKQTVQTVYEQWAAVTSAVLRGNSVDTVIALTSGADTINRIVNINTNTTFYNATTVALAKQSSDVTDALTEFAEDLSAKTLETWGEIDSTELIYDLIADTADKCAKFVEAAKSAQANVAQVILVDADGNDTTLSVYGHRVYTWKSGDTMDKLANRFLGDADYAPFLAYYNELAVESEIETGTQIKIPMLTQNATDTRNKIYAEPQARDNYGVDMALDDDGEFVTEGGDFATVGGADNLAQALSVRLTTASANRLRLTSYGIRSATGDTMALQSYLLGSIEQTVLADPRVESVESITLEGAGDSLSIKIVYTDINGAQNTYEGEV